MGGIVVAVIASELKVEVVTQPYQRLEELLGKAAANWG